ncbi:MAG TPA: substrate binding domain-containing protein [Kofleriaceae bacterium]
MDVDLGEPGRERRVERLRHAHRGARAPAGVDAGVGRRAADRAQPPELRRRYPELRLEIDLSDRNVPLVQGGFDLAIRVGRLSDSSLRAQLLGRVPVRLVASPSYVAAHGEPARPLALRDHACLTIAQVIGPVEWSFYHHRTRTRSERLEIEGVVHTTSPLLAAQLACAGQGILRVNEWVIRDQLARGELVEILRDWSCYRLAQGGAPVYVVYAQTASAAPPLKSRVFVQLLKEILAAEVLSRTASQAGRPAPPRGRAPR